MINRREAPSGNKFTLEFFRSKPHKTPVVIGEKGKQKIRKGDLFVCVKVSRNLE